MESRKVGLGVEKGGAGSERKGLTLAEVGQGWAGVLNGYTCLWQHLKAQP